MRIRKGARCVPLLAASDRPVLLMKGFVREDANAAPRQDRNQARAVTAASRHGRVQAVAGSGAGTGARRLDEVDDGARPSRLPDDGRSRKRPPIAAGVISITTIIQAGIKAAKRDSASSPASGESAITSVAKLGRTPDWSPSIADQPGNRLLDSLKKVCAASENTGLTAKEAVAKILEQGLPGLVEGGERLIVQVAKHLRGSPAFAEREERGRYYMQETFQELVRWDEANLRHRDAPKVKEEATTVCEAVGFTATVRRSGAGRWVLALRGNHQKLETSPEPRLRCNRDDGKGWRCCRLAESGFSLCNYHREQIRKAENRRRKSRSKSKKRRTSTPMAPVTPPAVSSAPVQSDQILTPANSTLALQGGDVKPEPDVEAHESENELELADNQSRRVVKAKSLKSL